MKPENILMSEDGYLKLSDFGVAKILPNIEDCRSTSGTHGYMVTFYLSSKLMEDIVGILFMLKGT